MRVAIPLLLIVLLVAVAGCTGEEPQSAAQAANQMSEQTPGETKEPTSEPIPEDRSEENTGQKPEQNPEQSPEHALEQMPEQSQGETTDQDSEHMQSMDEQQPTLFSLQIGDALLSLGDWDDKIDLAEMLGPPVDEQIIELGDADTFTGSFLKKLTYDGLLIDLFSPQHNGETFWILQMIVDKEGFPTSEGIEVGSTWEALQAAYPEMTRYSADGNSSGYKSNRVYSESQYEYLQFEIEDGLVTKIFIIGSL